MTRLMHMLPVFLVAGLVIILAVSSPYCWANDEGDRLNQISFGDVQIFSQIPFDEAEVFIEINATDGDAGFQAFFDGFQAFFDGEGWESVRIVSPNGKIFQVQIRRSLRDLGLTEVGFETEKPDLI